MTIHLFDTQAQVREIRAEAANAMLAVLDSGRYVLGPEVQAFEAEFAEFLGVDHVVGVANGTDAITLALLALGVGPGDDVLVPSFTFYASVEAIPHTGAHPVFCDVDPETFCVTAESVERALTPATRAVVAVHLFGNVAPVDDVREALAGRGIAIVEDAAQAAGARADGRRAGALGDAATFSFFPSKNLFCLGDGGAIATSREDVAERARELRFHGSRDKRTYSRIGFNSRLDALQAAVLRITLRRLDAWNDARRRLAAAYADAGLERDVTLPRAAPGIEPAHHLFVTRCDEPDSATAALRARAIESRSYYRTPVHAQPAMSRFAPTLELPGTEIAARTNLALPMAPSYGEEVASAVTEALRARARGETADRSA